MILQSRSAFHAGCGRARKRSASGPLLSGDLIGRALWRGGLLHGRGGLHAVLRFPSTNGGCDAQAW